MILTTAYALPYAVLYGYDPIMSVGHDVQVVAGLASVPSPGAVDAMDSLLQPFVLLEQSGALAGSLIPPWVSTIADKSGPTIVGNSIHWLLQECLIDERAIPMLAQMLVSVQQISQTRRLAIQRVGGPTDDQLVVSAPGQRMDYPGIYANLPFTLLRAYVLAAAKEWATSADHKGPGRQGLTAAKMSPIPQS
jgi:hypothetical protein